jgi:hypothetical protein
MRPRPPLLTGLQTGAVPTSQAAPASPPAFNPGTPAASLVASPTAVQVPASPLGEQSEESLRQAALQATQGTPTRSVQDAACVSCALLLTPESLSTAPSAGATSPSTGTPIRGGMGALVWSWGGGLEHALIRFGATVRGRGRGVVPAGARGTPVNMRGRGGISRGGSIAGAGGVPSPSATASASGLGPAAPQSPSAAADAPAGSGEAPTQS